MPGYVDSPVEGYLGNPEDTKGNAIPLEKQSGELPKGSASDSANTNFRLPGDDQRD